MSWAWVGLGSGVGVAWAAWLLFLLGRPSADYATLPLGFRSTQNLALLAAGRNEVHALAMESTAGESGTRRHELEFRLPRYRGVMGIREQNAWVREFALPSENCRSIGFYLDRVAGEGSPWLGEERLGLVEAEWVAPDGRVFRLVDPGGARRGRLVELFPERQVGAGSMRRTVEGVGRLTVVTRDEGRVYVRGLLRVVGEAARELDSPPLGRLVRPGEAGKRVEEPASVLFYPEGRVTVLGQGAPPTRGELLAWVWGWERSGTVGMWVGMAGGLLGLGVGLLGSLAGRGGRFAGLRAGLGMGAAVLGLGLPAGLLVVPFHGPDEGRHAISFARLVGDRGEVERMIRLGQRLHTESLLYRPDEKLTQATRREPEPFYLDREMLRPGAVESAFPDYRKRSPLVGRIWAWMGPWLVGGSGDGGRVVLSVRGMHLVLAGLLFGIGAMVQAGAAGADRGARLAAWWPLGMFGLPTSLTLVTNYSPLLAGAGLVAGLVAALWIRPSSDYRIAAVLGLALGGLVQVSVNAIPLVAAVAVWLLHRPWAVPGGGTGVEGGAGAGAGMGMGSGGGRRVGWWLALAVGFAIPRAISTPEYREAWTELVPGQGGAIRWLVREPWVVWGLFCVFGAAWEGIFGAGRSSGVESSAGRESRRVTGRGWNRGRWVLWGLVVGVSWCSHPTLLDGEAPWRYYPNVPSTGCPVRTVAEMGLPAPEINSRSGRVGEVLGVVVGNLGLKPSDVILVRGLWGGLLNGEVRVPGWVGTLGVVLGLGGVITGATAGGRDRGWRGVVPAKGLVAVAAGGMALAMLAASYWPRNLHARYVLPLAAVGMALAILGWRTALESALRKRPVVTAGGLAVLVLLLQGTWAWSLVERFF